PAILQAALQSIYQEVCGRLKVTLATSSTVNTHRGSAPRSVVDRARKDLAEPPPAISGSGGLKPTFVAAFKPVKGFGLDRDDALALLHDWNKFCQQPWSQKELEHKVDDALKSPGWRGYLLARCPSPVLSGSSAAIARANRHAIGHRRRAR